MSIDTHQEQGTEPYSLERAQHEARYIYGVIAATFAVRNALDDYQTKQAGSSERFKQVMGTNRFGRHTISELQQDLALTELDRAHKEQIITIEAYLRQLDILSKMTVKREEQAQQDWFMERDIGLDVLLEDTSHLLPMPGQAAATMFGIDYLGDPPGPTRREEDIPYMYGI